MAYTISYTDAANKGTIVLEDNTLNTTTSLQIPGRNTTAYGSAIATNFLHLLENFAFNTAPSNGVEGQLWYDNTAGSESLKVYDGTNWVSAAGIKKAVSAPDVSASQLGDLWVDTDNQQLYLFSGSGWVLIGPEFSDGLSTGVSPASIIGTDNISYTVIQLDVLSKPAAIISTSAFTPKTAIEGFTTISPGVNLSSIDITGAGNLKFIGTSEKAESLVVSGSPVAAANFLRAEVISTTKYPINIQNNTGINYGLNAELNIGIEGSAGVIQHQIEGSNIDVRVKNNGILTTVLRVDSNLRVGINNTAPDEALDITGNLKASGTAAIDAVTQSETIGTGALVVKGGAGIAKNIHAGGTLNVAGTSTLTDIMPLAHNTYNLGTDAIKWKNIHSVSFTGNLVGNVSGTVSGRAGSADKLTSATTFQLAGDVTAPAFTFDGQSGGTTKTFNATISNTIIGGKSATVSSQADDEFLLNRVTGATGLAKITRANLFSSVATNPAGVMMAYGGNTAPQDWLMCDGSEYRISDYTLLFAAIGYNFGAEASVTTGFFKVPDLRGRTTVGKDNMGGTSANVITDESADIMGSQDGQENIDIQVTNLPDHKHDLRGDALTQFYAINDLAAPTTDTGAFRGDGPTATNGGQYLPNSGGIESDSAVGQPLNLMNPHLIINYIIYTLLI